MLFAIIQVVFVSVPSFGDSFFIARISAVNTLSWLEMVSVPSFGDSFFMMNVKVSSVIGKLMFPSPHSGILFLCENRRVPPGGKTGRVSVPSFGDSFFINFLCLNNEESISICFRPLIRGFFFYSVTLVKDDWNLVLTFPSPYSGILFLL